MSTLDVPPSVFAEAYEEFRVRVGEYRRALLNGGADRAKLESAFGRLRSCAIDALKAEPSLRSAMADAVNAMRACRRGEAHGQDIDPLPDLDAEGALEADAQTRVATLGSMIASLEALLSSNQVTATFDPVRSEFADTLNIMATCREATALLAELTELRPRLKANRSAVGVSVVNFSVRMNAIADSFIIIQRQTLEQLNAAAIVEPEIIEPTPAPEAKIDPGAVAIVAIAALCIISAVGPFLLTYPLLTLLALACVGAVIYVVKSSE